MQVPLTARTVVVGRRSLDSAYRALNQIMTSEGITDKVGCNRVLLCNGELNRNEVIFSNNCT